VEPVNILLVDDNDDVRAIMRIVLAVEPEIGEVREAGDGEAAVAICGEFRPDVVVLDLWMPHMDGGQASEKIRSLHPNAQIVAYSAALEHKPEWADEYVGKDEIPDPGYLIDLARNGTRR
jgi:CheY-like chemotaxis protein